MQSRIVKLINLILVGLIIISCQKAETKYSTELDSSIKKVIISYVKENSIDLKSKIVTVEWSVTDYRTDIYISNSNIELHKKPENTPIYYSVVDENAVVFIYSGIERFVSRDTREITREIDELLLTRNIQLSPDSGHFYRAPRWLYTSCENKSKLSKKIPPFEYNYIPCGYTLLQDTSILDSLYIVKNKF